jgi:hypothetical protein
VFRHKQLIGKIFSGPDAGKGFQLGSEKNSQILLEFVKAYNSQDEEKQLSFYTPELAKKRAEMTKKSIAYIKKVNDEPIAILPIKVAGSTDEIVMLQSVEYREAKNGSKETLNLFELFKINKEGKIADFDQYGSIPKTNEYGQTSGGKFYSADANNGRAFQFSNRGEVEMIEEFNKAYNALDIETVLSFFADKVKITDFDGNKLVIEKKDLRQMMNDFKSVEWKITGILPIKIAYTDPVSGVFVTSTEKRVAKDGTVWNKSLVEIFQFDLNGKIAGLDQFSQGIK